MAMGIAALTMRRSDGLCGDAGEDCFELGGKRIAWMAPGSKPVIVSL